MRSLIQYDLDEPLTGPTNPLGPPPPPHRHTRRPPTKKRKRNQFGPARETPLQHWDDPGSAAVGVVYDEQERGAMTPAPLAAGSDMVSYTDDVEEGEVEYGEEPTVEGEDAADADAEQGEGEEEEEEESRVLTHEEIWDDAALINAWNSAEAEYKAYHGASKAWKTEPVKKSPLWYNKPYTAPPPPPGLSKPKARSKRVPNQEEQLEGAEADTAPLDFYTFVPTHDPSLHIPSNTNANSVTTAPFFFPPSTTMVSRDEAFNNALSAMYWGGYWTAVYHCQSQSTEQNSNVTAEATDESEIEAVEDEEDLVPAQR